MINKGTISALYNDEHNATVTPYLGETVTVELVVPWHLYKSLSVGMPVVYAAFEDCTGIILERMDGEWSHEIREGVEIVTGNVDITAGDMTTASVPSYNGHTHTCPDGLTSGPQ